MRGTIKEFVSNCFASIKKLIHDCLTGIDGKTYDPARVAFCLGALSFLGIALLAVWRGQPWNPQEFGVGWATVTAGGAAAVALKAKQEPPQ